MMHFTSPDPKLVQELALLDRVPLGLCVFGADGVVLWWNACLESWTGILRQDIVGDSIGTRLPHLAKPPYPSRFQQVFESGAPTVFSSQLHAHIIPAPLPCGTLRTFHTTVSALPNPSGDGFLALLAVEDVTGLSDLVAKLTAARDRVAKLVKDTARESRRMSTLLDAAVNPLLVISETGNLLAINGSAERLFGYDRREAIGKPFDMLVPGCAETPTIRSLPDFLTASSESRVTLRCELTGRSRSGSVLPLTAAFNPISIGESLCVLVSLGDRASVSRQ